MTVWRNLTANDVEGVTRVADEVHPGLPEQAQVFAERVKLFPEGCLVLEQNGQLCGYAISHPIRKNHPPALDSLLGEIASDADQYYIHDLAILPELRGRGLATEAIDRLLAVAGRYPTTCLVSVYGTELFWSRFGFVPGPVGENIKEKLRGYAEDVVYLVRSNPLLKTDCLDCCVVKAEPSPYSQNI